MSNDANTSSPSGRGGLIQLAAYGAEDLVLTADPEMSFFKNNYQRHVNFSMESINLLFTDIPGFGKTNYITIRRSGDLLSRLYLELTLPSDPLLTTSYWTNRIGFNIISKVEFNIGKKLIDRMYGIWMHIWTELTHTTDMKGNLNYMVGKKANDGESDGLSCTTSHKLIIPLLFSFCRNPGLAIPLNAIRNNQDITLKFYFETKDNCIQTGTAPSDDISLVSVWADYIFLETEENRLYLQKPLEYLIEVNQHLERNLITGGTKSIRLPFTLPCKELFWCVYKLDTIKDKFTNFTDDNNNSMVTDMQLQFNTKNVFSSKALDNNYFNYIQAYNYHKGCPDLGVNCYSFAISPEEHSPSGFINFKHLSTAVMNITTTPNGFIHIFAFCYNILQIENGEIKLVYNY
jgi:hypothetical protein